MTVPAPKNDLKNLTDEEVRDLGRLDTSSGYTLDQEKFDTAQELVAITAAIGEARQTLRDLEDTKSEFLLGRENEVMDRVLALIERSKDALRQVTENHDELRSITAGVRELKNRLLSIRDQVLAMGQEFNDRAEAKLGELVARENTVREQERQNEQDRRAIEDARNDVEEQKASLKEEETKMADQRAQLMRGFEELEKKGGEPIVLKKDKET